MKIYRVTFSYRGAFGREVKEELDHENLEDALFDFLASVTACRNPSLTVIDVDL